LSSTYKNHNISSYFFSFIQQYKPYLKKGNPNSQIGRFGSGGESSKSHQQKEPTKRPQEIVRQLVKDVNQCIEESLILLLEGELFHALQKAEAAVKKDKILSKHREKYSLSIQQGQNLTYAT
jgi:ribosomal protein S7